MLRTVKMMVLGAMLIFEGCRAAAQTDTLVCGQRECTYYYWGTCWADCHGGQSGYSYAPWCATIVARHCYIDTFLNVIGVAAATGVYKDPHAVYHDSTMAGRVPEYFQLYEATADSFYLVAEARFDTAHPRYRMYIWDYNDSWGRVHADVPYIYEAYFDKPYTVRDSFYVAMTTNNNDFYYDENIGEYNALEHLHTTEYHVYEYGVHSYPGYYKAKVINPYDRNLQTQSNLARACRSNYELGWCYITDTSRYIVIFPIFDTTGLDLHGFTWVGGCDSIRAFHLLYIDSGKAYLSWNAGPQARWWDVSYGPSGTLPGRGTKVQSLTSMICLDTLRGGRRYVVYVREHCRDDTRGPWSDSVSFYLPATAGVQRPDASLVDNSTHIMPNPAGDAATIFSGFSISAIEVYTAAGTLVSTVKVNANSTQFDATKLPAGTYILRIRTSHGDTAQRLVIAR